MVSMLLVLGGTWLLARWLAEALPPGFKFATLGTVLVIIAAPLIGAASGFIMALSSQGNTEISLGDYLLSGLVNSVLAIAIAPFIIWHHRRKRRPA